jgi:hypothetical protein
MYETIIKIVENLVLPQHLYIESKNMNYYQSPMNFFINHEIHERTRKHEIHENFKTTDITDG